MSGKILIAGIGNIFFGDDGFGVEVSRRLALRTWPDGVQVVDFGIRGYDLAFALTENWESALLVDAVSRGGEPGTLYLIEPDTTDLSAQEQPEFDAHSMHPLAVLQLVERVGGTRTRITLLGCEPANVSEGAGVQLTPLVAAAVDEAVTLVESWVANALDVPTPAKTTVATVPQEQVR